MRTINIHLRLVETRINIQMLCSQQILPWRRRRRNREIHLPIINTPPPGHEGRRGQGTYRIPKVLRIIIPNHTVTRSHNSNLKPLPITDVIVESDTVGRARHVRCCGSPVEDPEVFVELCVSSQHPHSHH